MHSIFFCVPFRHFQTWFWTSIPSALHGLFCDYRCVACERIVPSIPNSLQGIPFWKRKPSRSCTEMKSLKPGAPILLISAGKASISSPSVTSIISLISTYFHHIRLKECTVTVTDSQFLSSAFLTMFAVLVRPHILHFGGFQVHKAWNMMVWLFGKYQLYPIVFSRQLRSSGQRYSYIIHYVYERESHVSWPLGCFVQICVDWSGAHAAAQNCEHITILTAGIYHWSQPGLQSVASCFSFHINFLSGSYGMMDAYGSLKWFSRHPLILEIAAARGPATQWFKINFDKKGLLAHGPEVPRSWWGDVMGWLHWNGLDEVPKAVETYRNMTSLRSLDVSCGSLAETWNERRYCRDLWAAWMVSLASLEDSFPCKLV